MPTLDLENKLREENPGLVMVAGLDEVGVAPLAGPLVSAAVILPPHKKDWFDEVDDSKVVSAQKREILSVLIRRDSIWGIGAATSKEIDENGPMNGRVTSMRRAFQMCSGKARTKNIGAVVDGESMGARLKEFDPAIFVNKGDSISISIAAASIIAKVARDTYMHGLAMIYPHWGFDSNVGYGTPDHLNGIRKFGLCPEHRLRWRPVRECFSEYMGSEEG